MRPVRVGIVGYGTVGQATARIIASHAQDVHQRSDVFLTVTKVCRRTPIPSSELPQGVQAVSDWKQLVHADDVDIVVETIGGTTVAGEAVRASLENGKPVVTANKNLIAESGEHPSSGIGDPAADNAMDIPDVMRSSRDGGD